MPNKQQFPRCELGPKGRYCQVCNGYYRYREINIQVTEVYVGQKEKEQYSYLFQKPASLPLLPISVESVLISEFQDRIVV